MFKNTEKYKYIENKIDNKVISTLYNNITIRNHNLLNFNKPDVSIIIVNYNTSKLINECIESIITHTKDILYEIIIIDNNTENLCETINTNGIPVTLIQLSENIGFGSANNQGFNRAKGRNIFCLNPDTIIINNAIKILSDYLDSHPDVGACGGNLYDEKYHPTLSYKIKFPGFFEDFDQLSHRIVSNIIYKGNYMFNHSKKNMKVAYVSGADLMIQKCVIEQVGGYDTDFFLYYEETELQYRIKKAGYTIESVPSAMIIHLEGKSFQLSRTQEKASLISKKLFFNKTKGVLYQKSIMKFYYLITKIYYWFSVIFKMNPLKLKFQQRIEILNEIN